MKLKSLKMLLMDVIMHLRGNKIPTICNSFPMLFIFTVLLFSSGRLNSEEEAVSLTKQTFTALMREKVSGDNNLLFSEPPTRIANAESYAYFMILLKKMNGDVRLGLKFGKLNPPDGRKSDAPIYYSEIEDLNHSHIVYSYIEQDNGVLVFADRYLRGINDPPVCWV